MTVRRRGRPLHLLGHLGFLLLCVSALAFCIDVTVGALTLVGRRFPGFTVTREGYVNPASLHVWDADRAGLRSWSDVLDINGARVPTGSAVWARAEGVPEGGELVVRARAVDGEEFVVRLPARTFSASDFVKSHTSLALLGLIFVGVAALLYVLRPGTPEAWGFFLFFSSLGVAMASVVDMTCLWRWPPLYPRLAPMLAFFGFVLVGVITRAFTSRGRRRSHRWLSRVWWTITAIGLLGGAALNIAHERATDDIARYLLVDRLMYLFLVLGTLTALAALVIAYRRGRSAQQRARLRQILWAWPVGAGVPLLNVLFGQVLELFPMSLLWNGFLVLVPLATADAVVRHDLLRLTTSARRLIGGMTVASVVGMALGLVMWGAVQFLRLHEAAGMVALAALLFAVAAPLTHRVQRYVDNLLRARSYDAGPLLARFTARASTAQHLVELTALLDEVLQDSLRPAAVRLFRLDPTEQCLLPILGSDNALPFTGATRRLLETTELAFFDEEDPPPPGLDDAGLTLRLAVAGEPIGLLALSPRPDAPPFEAGDAAFVSSLAGPLTAALINTRAYEQVEALNLDLEARVIERTRELAQKNDELALLNLRKDELVATVSHDFRSPLAIIRQNVQTLLRDQRHMDADDMRSFLEGIARQEDRLTSMCQNLLDLARLKQAKVTRDVVDVSSLAQQLLDGFAQKAAANGVELRLSLATETSLRIRGDRDRLGQLLQNLLDNALKFTTQGDAVEVALRPGNAADTLVLEVEDSGCGVPAEALPRLFEPFYQVPSTAYAGQGSGLGLAIVKAVVDAHEGTIAVQSREGEGTRFTVTLRGVCAPAEVA